MAGEEKKKEEKVMARPMSCSVEGCDFVTDPSCETRQEVREDLTFHRVEVHEAAASFQQKLAKESADLRIKELKATAESKAQEAELVKQKANLVKLEKGLTVTDDSSAARRGKRRAPLTRPSVMDDCTESDWSFFKASWGRYVTACRLEETEVTAHL